MSSDQFGISYAALLIAGGAGAQLLRSAWSDRRNERSALKVAGSALITFALIFAIVLIGPVLGIAFAVAALPLGALCVVGSNATRRVAKTARASQLAPEPLEGGSRAWRGWLKALLAGPLGMLSAMGIAFAYAVWAPGAVQTRLLIAALLVPALWGLAMTWTLADQRLLRSTFVLSAAAVLGFGVAALGGVA